MKSMRAKIDDLRLRFSRLSQHEQFLVLGSSAGIGAFLILVVGLSLSAAVSRAEHRVKIKADQLTEVMHHIPSRRVEAVELPAPAVQKMSVSAYVMVTIRPDAEAASLFRGLYYMDDVVYCDAVHGQYDVVLLLNAASADEIDQIVRRIGAMPGVGGAETYGIVPPVIEPAIAEFIKDYEHNLRREDYRARLAGTAVSAYLFVEIEQGRFGEVFPKLYFMNGVVSCDATRGQYDAVLLIQSPTFKGIEKIVNEDVRMIDGIVRTRSVKVITMYEM